MHHRVLFDLVKKRPTTKVLSMAVIVQERLILLPSYLQMSRDAREKVRAKIPCISMAEDA
jgi:hypothetical protein